MRLRRALPDWALPVGLACLVLAFTAGSSPIKAIHHPFLHIRWWVLVAVSALAVYAAVQRVQTEGLPRSRGLLRFGVLVGAFLALTVLSTAWSVTPRSTFEHAVSLGILFVLAGAVALATFGDVVARLRLFQGIGAGAIIVGVLGVLLLIVDYDKAKGADLNTWRYEGFTENPNTISILAGATLPILVGLALAS